MQAVTLENDAVRRFASGHMFPMAKLVLETAFQPIVEATTGTIFGYESLMRGHDRLGSVSYTHLTLPTTPYV